MSFPLPTANVTIRPGVMTDLPFIDGLQKLHTRMVGWMPMKQLEEKVRRGHVIVAEQGLGVRGEGLDEEVRNAECGMRNGLAPNPQPLTPSPVGYCIGHDQYFKRDDVGIIYQMNVLPGRQRAYVGAALLRAQFERSAYGCRLYCCWCAQDLAANYFWEAMGFVPLAFRAGGVGKQMRKEECGMRNELTPVPAEEMRSAECGMRNGLTPDPCPLTPAARPPSARVHIFWQKRIRSGDGQTPWWYPSKTNSGSIREDRIVLPIPPGTHWSEVRPLLLPEQQGAVDSGQLSVVEKRPRAKKAKPIEKPTGVRRNGLWFDVPKPGEPVPEANAKNPPDKPKAQPRVKRACDPKLAAAARELRDRYLEHVNTTAPLLAQQAKYDVSRQLEAPGGSRPDALRHDVPLLTHSQAA